MARYASGKKAWGYSDRSGFRYRLREMRKEWNGLKVGKDEYEPKHPQLEPRSYGAEGHGLANARPARAETDALAILGPDPFSTISSGSGIINVYEKSHGRSSSDTVRFRGPVWTSSDPDGFQNPVDFDGISGSNIAKSAGYSITVGKRDSSGDVTATDDYYYFTVDTNTATSGGVSGGGNNCTAGPATLTN